MKTDVDDLRNRVESRLQQVASEWDARLGDPAGTSRVFVSVSPTSHLTVTLVSRVFEGKDYDERDETFWTSLVDVFSEAELDAIDFWQMLTQNEAKRFYPTFLGERLTLSHS